MAHLVLAYYATSPPLQLRQTVAVHLSPLFTQLVLDDADATAEQAVELAATAIAGTLYQLLTPAQGGTLRRE